MKSHKSYIIFATVLINIFFCTAGFAQDEFDKDLSFVIPDTIAAQKLPIENWLESDFFNSRTFSHTDTIVFTEDDILNSTALTLGTFLEENSFFYLFD